MSASDEAQEDAPSPIKRTPLQKFDVPGTNYETVIGITEIAANVNVGRHTHPGPESRYVLEGDYVLPMGGTSADVRATLIRAGAWIDLHASVSGVGPNSETRQGVVALVRALEVREK